MNSVRSNRTDAVLRPPSVVDEVCEDEFGILMGRCLGGDCD